MDADVMGVGAIICPVGQSAPRICFGFMYRWLCVLQDRERATARNHWVWLLACAAATLVTPHPLGLFHMIWDDFSFSPERIYGWMPPALGEMKWFVGTLIVFWVFQLRQYQAARRSWPLIVLSVLLTVGSLRHVVYVSYFMIVAVPELAAELSFLGERWLRRQKIEWFAAVLAFGFFIVGISQAHPALGVYRLGVFDFIRDEKIAGPFFNDYLYGGHWMWEFAGHPPVFIDGRYPAAVASLAKEIVAATAGLDILNQFMDHYGIQAALMKYYWDSPRPSVYEAIFPRQKWALCIGTTFARFSSVGEI